ncbi:MAG: HD domain-containing protein [Planctomycetes bacterium]|nr:HD domain-containing protein [Planctomycetota bacterium]
MSSNAPVDKSMVINESLEALALVLEYNNRDFPDHQHGRRVGEGCALIGEKLGLPPRKLQQMYYAGLLHDIGKISIDINLLGKREKLTDEEFTVIKKHSIFGSRILATLPGLNDLALMVRWHHEWWNGSGYPDGLAGEEIPIEVRILCAIDCFDSLQTPRLDRDRRSPEDAYTIIEDSRGKQFDPKIIDLVLEMIHEKTLVPGKSSNKFLTLKKKYIDVPIYGYGEELKASSMAGLYPILRLFARVIDAKHKYTRGHSTRVSILSKYLAEKMQLSPSDILKVEIAGLLHDAGKVSVPIGILDKPGPPDDKEWEVIKGHAPHSFEILSKVSFLKDIADISASHHEKYDGTGYPNHLAGNQINYLAQIIAISDTYDAITSTRAYRKGLPQEYAYEVIRKGMGTQFNPNIARILLDNSPKYISALFDIHEVND